VQHGRIRPAIGHRDADQDIVDAGFRILDLNIEVTVAVENACVDQLEFRIQPRAPPVLAVDNNKSP
jgi:hypothetical protein